MSFQLKRGDEVIDGFRVLEPICEKQEYAIYRVEDGRYAICITADLKEVWENGNWIPDAFVSGQLHPLSCGLCYLTVSGYSCTRRSTVLIRMTGKVQKAFAARLPDFKRNTKRGSVPMCFI